jgi:hypothetical protein
VRSTRARKDARRARKFSNRRINDEIIRKNNEEKLQKNDIFQAALNLLPPELVVGKEGKKNRNALLNSGKYAKNVTNALITLYKGKPYNTNPPLLAEGVICTLPLGVLQNNKNLIKGLDADKTEAIKNLQPCLQNKIILEFENLRWLKQAEGGQVLNLIGTHGNYPALINSVNMQTMTEGKSHALMFSLYAKEAKFTKKDEEIKQDLMICIRQHFHDAPDPIDFHVTRWHEDLYTLSTWSRPGAQTTQLHVDSLMSLNKEGRLCLA